MSRIRSRDTKPELFLRKALFARGYRYRVRNTRLPGRPDIVLPKYKAVVFIHGCFWHGHHCPMFRLPVSRQEFWSQKIDRNRERDAKALAALQKQGWRTLVVWECTIRGRAKLSEEALVAACERFITDQSSTGSEITGNWQTS